MSVAEVLAGKRSWWVECGDALTALRSMPAGSVQVCVTSPPFFGLRDYGTGRWEGGDSACDHGARRWDGPKQTQGAQNGHASKADRLARSECRCGARRVDQQIGLEPTLEGYVGALVGVFAEVRRVLHPTGTLWLNLGDSYGGNGQHAGRKDNGRISTQKGWAEYDIPVVTQKRVGDGVKAKDLLMVPATVALALRADGWYLRSDIIWAKTACMPESVTDRPTNAHEHVFLMSKRATYFYDADAVREPLADTNAQRTTDHYDTSGRGPRDGGNRGLDGLAARMRAGDHAGRNQRNVWTVGPEPLTDDHYAAWPTEIPRRAILAGSKPGDVVLDCFSGSGRTLMVALRHGRRAVGIELSGYQAAKSRQRITDDCPMFNTEAAG